MKTYSDYQRYLASKKSVDDRALNQQVWRKLGDCIDSRMSYGAADNTFRILELGSGIGTMAERLQENGYLTGTHGVHCEYVAVDELVENSKRAKEYLAEWGTAWGLTVEQTTHNSLKLANNSISEANGSMTLHLETADLFDYLARAKAQITDDLQQPFDLVIAHAFLDLVDAAEALAQIRAVMKADGLLFTSINFDGATILQPEIDATLDTHIETLYHRTMDERIINGKRSGESKTGRHLFGHLQQAGFSLLEAGASDWVVFSYPTPAYTGRYYLADEAYFLHFIIETMHNALINHPEIEKENFLDWVAKRHQQIETQELTYIAHQLDFLAVLNP